MPYSKLVMKDLIYVEISLTWSLTLYLPFKESHESHSGKIFTMLSVWLKGPGMFFFVLSIKPGNALREKPIKKLVLQICHAYIRLFNFSWSFTFIFNSKSLNPSEYILVV